MFKQHLCTCSRVRIVLFMVSCCVLTVVLLFFQLENIENERNIQKSGIQEQEPKFQVMQTPWNITSNWLSARQVHPSSSLHLDNILRRMAKDKIIRASVAGVGTQIKMMFTFDGGQKVLFKPMTVPRDYIANATPYAGTDRHNGEIASFHLNRILGFNRGPLVIGRKVNLLLEIFPVADAELKKTFIYQENKTCFYGVCHYCHRGNAVCADETDLLEGTVLFWISHKLQKYRHPWARTYRKNVKAKWEVDSNYCNDVRNVSLYREGPRLLDLIDTAIFDFIIGNADRHHYEILHGVPNGIVLLLDNGKSFGDPFNDEISILAPLQQCCRIRKSTLDKLESISPSLSVVMRNSLSTDPVAPVLTEPHLSALDRRLKRILLEVDKCLRKQQSLSHQQADSKVVVDDGL